MRVRIEIDDSLEDEIVVRCKNNQNIINKIKQAVDSLEVKQIEYYIKDQVFYLDIEDLLFFETSDHGISAHTINEVYTVKYKLYELEHFLPTNFIRISKSTISNINHIKSINRNITSVSIVEFIKSHKKVYASRFYYKNLREKLKERL